MSLNGITRRRALEPLRVGDVLRFEAVVGVVEAGRALEPVGAALGDDVDPDAAGLLRHVDAAGVDRDLLERIEIEIVGRRAGGGHVGDVDAVERELRVVGHRAARHEVGLLPRHVAADVFAIHGDPGRLLQDDPWIACRRNALQQIVGKGLPGSGGLRVDNRTLSAHGDRFLHGRYGQLCVDLGAEPDGHSHVLGDHGLEAGEREVHGVGTDAEPWKLIRAGVARHRDERLQQHRRRQRDGDSRHDRAGLIGDLAEDLPGLLLRIGQRAHREKRDQCDDDPSHPHPFTPATAMPRCLAMLLILWRRAEGVENQFAVRRSGHLQSIR